MEDSTAMTIDFLRARLLAERSVSRTARQRADELSQRVMELEEQLQIVSLQRKKAEKATADVLAILGNHGRSDVSETFDSSSDYEGEIGTSSVKGEENETFSGSEHESSTQLCRSLSWKSNSDRHSLDKKYMDSSRRRRSSFASSGSSSLKHVGKSCRQIRRREHRSAVELSHNDNRSALCEDDVNTCSDIGHEISREGSGNGNERDLRDGPVSAVLGSRSVSNGHYSNNHRGDRDMERALQNQAQLIGQFEAEEKAQREWEEKFKENNDSTADSCDPGNQSDITEERDEMKSSAAPSFSNGIIVSQNPKDEFGEQNASLSNGIITSQNPKDEFGEQNASNDKDVNTPTSQPSEVKVDEHNKDNNKHPQPRASEHSPDLRNMPVNDSAHISSSSDIHNSYKGKSPETANAFALIPQENSDKLGSVLEALQQAKQSLRQNLNRSPVQKDKMIMRAKEPSFPSAGYRDRYAMPVISTGLFRLPTDYQYGVTDQVNSLGLASKLSTSNYFPDTAGSDFSSSPYRESKASSSNDDRFLTVPTFPYPEIRSRVPYPAAGAPSFGRYTNLDPRSSEGLRALPPMVDPIFDSGQPSGAYTNLHPHSSAGLPSSNRLSQSTHSPYPEMIPRIPSDVGVSSFLSNGDVGSSPSRFSFYSDHTRPNM